MRKLPGLVAKRQSGQALLLVLLVLSLVLTLVLSSVSKSVTDVQISTNEDNSIRAFDAAEAGIEKAVVGEATSGVTVNLNDQASFTPQIVTNTNVGNSYKYPLDLYSGEYATVYFTSHTQNADGDYVLTCSTGCKNHNNIPAQLRICWGKPGTSPNSSDTPAVNIEFYFSSDNTATVSKFENLADMSDIYVLSATADRYTTRGNNFSAADTGTATPLTCSTPSAFSVLYQRNTVGSPLYDINATGGSLLFIKVTMLYNTSLAQPLSFNSAMPLPSQGSIISSVGQSSDVYRKLVLFQGFPEIPYELGNAFYSRSAVNK